MPLLSSYIFRFFLLSPHSIFLPHHHPVVLLPPSSFPSFSPPPLSSQLPFRFFFHPPPSSLHPSLPFPPSLYTITHPLPPPSRFNLPLHFEILLLRLLPFSSSCASSSSFPPSRRHPPRRRTHAVPLACVQGLIQSQSIPIYLRDHPTLFRPGKLFTQILRDRSPRTGLLRAASVPLRRSPGGARWDGGIVMPLY